MERLIAGSRIAGFFLNLNRNLIVYFYNSKTHGLFININAFFRNAILRNADESAALKLVKKIAAHIERRDIGIFIILTVLFNTLAMAALGREIDVFSACARIAFFVLGAALCIWKKNAG
jgi:hypothetical protein